MKKNLIKLVVILVSLSFNGQAYAQNDLGNFFGKILNSASSKKDTNNDEKDDDKKQGILEGLSNIFSGNKVASKEDLVGKWTYSEPAVMFDSESALHGIGGKLVAEGIEDKLQKLLDKYGLIKDAMTLTFDEDGNFLQQYKKLQLKGTYTVEGNDVLLKYSGRYKQIIGSTQIDGDNLVIVMDLDRLNETLQVLSQLSTDPKVKALSKLLGNFKGVQCGMRFTK